MEYLGVGIPEDVSAGGIKANLKSMKIYVSNLPSGLRLDNQAVVSSEFFQCKLTFKLQSTWQKEKFYFQQKVDILIVQTVKEDILLGKLIT